jgi:hypothetical protein
MNIRPITNETLEILYEAYIEALLNNSSGNETRDEMSSRIDIGTLGNVASLIFSSLVPIL